jgi:hypothetical protein
MCNRLKTTCAAVRFKGWFGARHGRLQDVSAVDDQVGPGHEQGNPRAPGPWTGRRSLGTTVTRIKFNPAACEGHTSRFRIDGGLIQL